MSDITNKAIKLKVKCKSYFTIQNENALVEWFEGDTDEFLYYPESKTYITSGLCGMEIHWEDFKESFTIIL